MTIRLIVSGAGGNLAGPIIDAANRAEDIDVTGLYNPNRGGSEIGGHHVSAEASELAGDVVVETAHPDVVFENLEAWKNADMAAVVGTCGFTEERLVDLEQLWSGAAKPCLVVPNFSVGAVLMMEFARTAARYFDAVEIVERHSSAKRDAPSGTSLATAMGVASGGGASAGESDELVPGARGADVNGVRVHSMRLPGLISQQEVALSNPGEVLSVDHISTSYEAFANGAMLAVRNIGSLDPGVHLGLAALLE